MMYPVQDLQDIQEIKQYIEERSELRIFSSVPIPPLCISPLETLSLKRYSTQTEGFSLLLYI
jgi:hypothetical protein